MFIEFNAEGSGVPILFVPGSYSTPSAWRPIQAFMPDGFKLCSVSLCGYGKTAETRNKIDCGIDHQLKIISHAIDKIGTEVHLVGHSFGGLASLAFIEKFPGKIKTFTLFEANPISLLDIEGDSQLFDEVSAVGKNFIKEVKKNTKFAAKQIIDFYGGDGFFNEMPEHVQAFCNDCAAANALDWQSGPYVNFDKNRLNELLIPATIVSGGNTNTYMKRVTHHLKSYLPRAQFLEINGAGHFLISTHAEECSRILINSVSSA